MVKITKSSLTQLAQEMHVLAGQEQKMCVGGANSTYSQLGDAFGESRVESFASIQNPLSTQIGDFEAPYSSTTFFDSEVTCRQHDIFATAFIEELDSAVSTSGGIGVDDMDEHVSGMIGSGSIGSGSIDSSGASWDPNKAVAKLRQGASNSSQGRCAGAVMNAIEAGGESSKRVGSAHQMNDGYLSKCGFEKVSKDNYTPQKGDVIVIEAVPGHKHGHTAMFDGTRWISDFYQRDAFGSSAYKKPGVVFEYYRHK